MTGDPTLLLSVLTAAACGLGIGLLWPRPMRSEGRAQPYRVSVKKSDTLVIRVKGSEVEADSVAGHFGGWADRAGVSVLVLPPGFVVEGVISAPVPVQNPLEDCPPWVPEPTGHTAGGRL